MAQISLGDNPTIRKIVIFGNNYKKENLILIKPIFDFLRQNDIDVAVEAPFFQFLMKELELECDDISLVTDDDFNADVAISMGGDGTFLKTAAKIGHKGIPIIGINTGRLGFLADVASTEVIEPLTALLRGEYVVEERSCLQLDCSDGQKFDGNQVALNEVAILKQDSSSMITIRTYLNGHHLVDYQADGLIVATPTGSTAYSMSNGGPIIMPSAHDIILSPVAPHSLTVRPLVVPDDSTLVLDVVSRTNSFLCSIDGRSELFDETAVLKVCKADYMVKVIKQHDDSFVSTLKNKLMWGVDRRPALK